MSRSIQNYVLSLQQKLYPKIVGKCTNHVFLDIFRRLYIANIHGFVIEYVHSVEKQLYFQWMKYLMIYLHKKENGGVRKWQV